MIFFFWYFTTVAVLRLLIFFAYRKEEIKPPTRGSFLSSAITFALIATYAYTGSQIAIYAILLYVATSSVFFLGAAFAKERR